MKKIIYIVVIILILFSCYWFFFVINNPSKNNGGMGQLKSLFPYGVQNYNNSGSVSQEPGKNNAHTETQVTQTDQYNPLIQLSTKAVIGITVVTPPSQVPSYMQDLTSTSTVSIIPQYQSTIFSKTKLPVVRFAEHGTGYIYDVDARAQNETKQTGTTILRAYEAYFGDFGNSVVIRYLKNDNATIETFLGKIVPPANDNSGQFASLKGDFLPENILNFMMSPDGNSFDYALQTDNGLSGVYEKIDGTGEKQVFTTDLSEWLFDLKQGGLSATTKASSGIPGYSYIISNTGIFKKVIGEVNGLTTNMSPDSRQLLYNSADGNSIVTYIRQANGNSNKLSVSTLAEKCVWSKKSVLLYCAIPSYIPGGDYPDVWYQGLAHFQDSIWKIDTVSGNAVKINDLADLNIDAVLLTLDQNENFLFFKNNNDGTPWSLDLKPTAQKTK